MSIATIPKHVTLFDDDAADDGRNLKGVKSEVYKEPISAMNYAACRYRPVYNFWGVNGSASALRNRTDTVRVLWHNSSPGAPGLGARCLVVPSVDNTTTTRYVTFNVTAGFTTGNADTSVVAYTPKTTTSGEAYPNNCVPVDGLGEHESYSDDLIYENTIGVLDEDGPILHSGLMYERMNFNPRYIKPTVGDGTTPEHHQAMPTDWIGPGLPIVGSEQPDEEVGDIRSISQVRDFFRRTYKGKRLHFAWSGRGAETGGSTGIFTMDQGAAGNYRYIFDRTVGNGSGSIAPSATGPGINIPVRYTASGRSTSVRIYVAVYADMDGASGVGHLGIFNLNQAGVMNSLPVALTNGPTISGTGMQWYGAVGAVFDPDQSYFLANADTSLVYDHVLLCATRTSTSKPRIGGVVMFAYHAG